MKKGDFLFFEGNNVDVPPIIPKPPLDIVLGGGTTKAHL